MRIFVCVCLFWVARLAFAVDETWQSALSQMPLGTNVTQLNRTNCVEIMLRAFGSNDVVKGFVFMPGATDEFYMFRRAKAQITNPSPTLLDAVIALTNQTLIRATFRPPLLLLHTDEDPLNPLAEVKDAQTAVKIEWTPFVPHIIYNDRDWDYLLPILTKTLKVKFTPILHSRNSWHFYRHSFSGWNLNGREALEAVALAGKTRFTIEHKKVAFEGDERVRAVPKIDFYPFNN
jgi:hypothetical protein